MLQGLVNVDWIWSMVLHGQLCLCKFIISVSRLLHMNTEYGIVMTIMRCWVDFYLSMRFLWILCMFRGESLDNLDSQRSSSWKPTSRLSQSTGIHASSSVQDFSHPPPQLLSTSNRAYLRNPSSSVPPPAAGPGKPTAQTPTLHSQSASASQPASQPRSRWDSHMLIFSFLVSVIFF